MDKSGEYHTEWSYWQREGQMQNDFPHIQDMKKHKDIKKQALRARQ